ncbi:MAG: Blue-light-activated protein [Verrucomicrobiales bacterium]|nr:Blue-light-activated protein [Verrucomicrobiales bacterium]
MTHTTTPTTDVSLRAHELFKEQQLNITKHTDIVFARLMIFQWLAGIAAALMISPHTWTGTESHVHIHVWAAVLLGGLITSVPVAMAFLYPGRVITRHTIAIGQMLTSALLIHLTGGRIETHFHVFGSLAILAFYRDWRVLVSASAIVFVDHLARGFLWPQSVYGVMSAPIWRSFEHAGWVVFEVVFLIISIRKSLVEMLNVAERQARLEALNETIEKTVAERTAELRREIAERREAEEQLKKSQSQLAQAQQIAHIGSWEWDICADKVCWSDETARLYGFAPEDAGMNMEACLKRLHPDDILKVREALQQAAQTGKPYECDHRVMLPDTTERVMQGRGEVTVDSNGIATKILGTAQDITVTRRNELALRRSEEQLRQSQKMEAVGRLAGGVAHDFNNLLTVITGYCALLMRRLPHVDPIRPHAEQIQRAAERAASLTRQLLAFSRKQVLQPRTLDLAEIVHGMEKMLHRLIGEDIELRTISDPGAAKVQADPGQIEQVILNMAVNARDAMPQGGKLTIRISNVIFDQKTVIRNRGLDAGAYVMMAISDSGVGMTPEVRAHLFEPFFTTKGVGKGTGLGLATCYGIISQSGGDVRVYSEPGSGTTFKIYLPAIQSNVLPAPMIDETDALPGGTETILIVEDDEAVRTLASAVLGECGYSIELARDGAEALAVIESGRRFDMILTDVIMPKVSGRQLYDRAKEKLQTTKVLFMSGYTDDALANRGVLEQGFNFLEKPFSPTGLANKVRKVLDGIESDTSKDIALTA